jgi:4-cresol dehydrogenase (hydroxylating)
MQNQMTNTIEMYQAALIAFEQAVGKDFVATDAVALQRASTATFPTIPKVCAIVKPASRAELQQCMSIAGQFCLPVYLISSGKNWGYGSRVPVKDDSILIDLSRLNRILDFSEELAWVTIEPGVTQRQLLDYLKARNSKLWIDATGSSPDASLIGNSMERGFGHTTYGDHAAQLCGLEVLLPNGDVIETGMARFASALASPVYRWGLGPSLDGLFTQSNLGIVTRATLWLMPAPEYFQAMFFRCDDANNMPAIIDALRSLRMDGTLRSAIHIANDYKAIAGIRQYPWRETGGLTPLTPDRMAKFRKEMKFGAWNGSAGLYGSRAQVAEARRRVRKALTGKVEKITFLDDRVFALATRHKRLFGAISGWDISKALDLASPVYGLMKGIPTDRPLAAAYWRKRTPPPATMDPDRDGCGLLWYAPVAPLEGGHARILAEMASRIVLRHRLEPMLSFTLISERALICVISLSWDREVPEDEERAGAAHEELQRELTKAGYPPYRTGIASMETGNTGGAYARMLQAIRRHTDPDGLFAAGRYDYLPR